MPSTISFLAFSVASLCVSVSLFGSGASGVTGALDSTGAGLGLGLDSGLLFVICSGLLEPSEKNRRINYYK